MSMLNRRDAVKLSAGMVLGAGAVGVQNLLGQQPEPRKQEQEQPQPPPPEVADPMLANALANAGSFLFTQQATLKLEGTLQPLHITSARDAQGNPMDLRLPTASMRIFRADASRDEFTRQGGWYWNCGELQGHSKFESDVAWSSPAAGLGPLVMAVRDREGNVQWFALGYDLRC